MTKLLLSIQHHYQAATIERALPFEPREPATLSMLWFCIRSNIMQTLDTVWTSVWFQCALASHEDLTQGLICQTVTEI